MNRYTPLSLTLGLAVGLAACAPAPAEPSASPLSTPHDMASMSEPPFPSPSRTTSAAPSPGATGHDMRDMDGSGQTVEVDIANFAFVPLELTISAGTEVVFTNSDAAPHTVTAGTDDEPTPEVFDSGLLQTGDEFRFTAYGAEREASAHMFMTGQVLAAAIAGQFPDRFAAMMPDAAMPAPAVPSPLIFIGLGLASVAVLGLSRRAIEVRSRA